MRLSAALAILCIIVAMVALFAVPMLRQADAGSEKEIEQLSKIIDKALVQCYALEGSYPTSLGYLEDNYGLSLNHEKYIFVYDTRGMSNIKPNYAVLVNEGRDVQ